MRTTPTGSSPRRCTRPASRHSGRSTACGGREPRHARARRRDRRSSLRYSDLSSGNVPLRDWVIRTSRVLVSSMPMTPQTFDRSRGLWHVAAIAIATAAALTRAAAGDQPVPRALVLDNVRIIDGSGAAPIENGRIVIEGDQIARAGAAAATPAPAGAERVDLAGRTVIPGLIDLHFHIENAPKMGLRQLSRGVTAFRDPGQWNEKFVELRRMIAADNLPGPRIFMTGPHIDGENPAYP